MQIAPSANGAPALKVRGYWRTVGYRLRYDYVTLFFALVILCIALSAIFAPWLAPFDPLKTSVSAINPLLMPPPIVPEIATARRTDGKA